MITTERMQKLIKTYCASQPNYARVIWYDVRIIKVGPGSVFFKISYPEPLISRCGSWIRFVEGLISDPLKIRIFTLFVRGVLSMCVYCLYPSHGTYIRW